MNDQCIFLTSCSQVNTPQCASECIRYLEFTNLLKKSNLPRIYLRHTVLTPDPVDVKAFDYLHKLKKDILNYVGNGYNLFIHSSNPGNGKTTWACHLMLAYFNKVWAGNGFRQRGLFVHTPTLLAVLKENIRTNALDLEALRKNLLEVDLVVWDELVVKDLTDYEAGYLLTFIEARNTQAKANIFTANGSQEHLGRLLGERLYSRVYNTSDVVEFKGQDKRTND